MKTRLAGLIALNFLSSTLCWLPMFIEPGLNPPVWLPLSCVSLSAFVCGFLNPRRWPVFLVSGAFGGLAGFCAGYALWWPRDPIAGPWAPIFIKVGTIVAALVAMVSAFVGSRVGGPDRKLRRMAWLALWACAIVGPAILALTPPVVAFRVARNGRLAAERVSSLQRAVQTTLASSTNLGQLCDGSLLARSYSGPSFSDEDWRRITGNYVKQDGYVFMIYCQEQAGYLINADPDSDQPDGMRRFCVDESGRTGCGMEWNRSRHLCTPCKK